MVEIIPVSTTLELQAADESHVPALHQLVLKNKRGYNSRSTGRNMSRRRRKRVSMCRVIYCCTSVVTPKCT